MTVRREERSPQLIIHDLTEVDTAQMGEDVIAGLSAQPKFLPPKYFYDEYGSQLFEQICELPEYYPTRTETAIFKQYSDDIVRITGPCEIAELGSGSATKTRILLSAYQRAQHPLRYIPIDVSGTMLSASAKQLLEDYPELSIQGLVGTYESALAHLPPAHLPARMLCFIGSTLGNLQPHECQQFLASISSRLRPKDFLLLGLDLQKEVSVLEAAYNDSQGITAKFNLNMLRHLNRQFEGDFDLDSFAHVAQYNAQQHQIEMYLESLRPQRVHLKAINFMASFEQNERLLSEISRKFDLNNISWVLQQQQLPVVKVFTDQNSWFGLLLCQRR